MILPVHQNPADLVLTIVPGNLQTPLTVLKQQSIECGAWMLTFHIIGESHLVTIARDDKMLLCELLACVDVDADVALHRHPFADLRPHCFEQAGYTVDVRFDDCTAIPPAAAAENTLEVTFPAVNGQTPVTRLVWSQHETWVRWSTLHVYPHAGKLVCVHSLSSFDALQYNRPHDLK